MRAAPFGRGRAVENGFAERWRRTRAVGEDGEDFVIRTLWPRTCEQDWCGRFEFLWRQGQQR